MRCHMPWRISSSLRLPPHCVCLQVDIKGSQLVYLPSLIPQFLHSFQLVVNLFESQVYTSQFCSSFVGNSLVIIFSRQRISRHFVTPPPFQSDLTVKTRPLHRNARITLACSTVCKQYHVLATNTLVHKQQQFRG